MVGAKSNARRKEPKRVRKKDTVRDLDVKGKATDVKGGQKKPKPTTDTAPTGTSVI